MNKALDDNHSPLDCFALSGLDSGAWFGIVLGLRFGVCQLSVRPIKNPERATIPDGKAKLGAILHRLWAYAVPRFALIPCVGADVDVPIILPPVGPVEFVQVTAFASRVSTIAARPQKRTNKPWLTNRQFLLNFFTHFRSFRGRWQHF